MFMMRVYPKTCISLMNEEINKTENVVKPELLTVVEEFDDDFALLTELPPKRDHDHKIPLVGGNSTNRSIEWDTICDFEESLSDLPSVKDAKKHYNWSNGQLLRKNKLVVGKDDQLRLELLAYFHGSSVGGHSSVKVTTHKYTPDLATYPDLLQRLPILNRIQESISMNFIKGLPKSQGHNVILVVMDKLTKTLEAREKVVEYRLMQQADKRMD
ncbi:retrotransposable element Tf2 [Tanacetum coccineum]|uniref:Retrotransposable element Tf2 n=1 Tax=Tanacetum coccineum TaxID=301880 RepID=A0ABQ4XPQ9_9ASTR